VTNNIDFGNATHGRPQIEIPSWVPDEVKNCIRNRIEPLAFLTDADHEAARRLANDPVMESVWSRPELKNRPGLDRLFWSVWAAARDGLRETTQKENELQLKVAQHEIDILRVVAARMEQEVENEFRRLARVDDDPLTRSYGRDSLNKYNKRPSVNSDARALGVGKCIAEFLNENFGTPMYGTARKLIIVALGFDPDKAPTKSAIRVAFEKDAKCAQGR
jgi:hypothetical protein